MVALANEDESNTDWLTYCGFNRVFVKPFDINILVKSIRTRNNS